MKNTVYLRLRINGTQLWSFALFTLTLSVFVFLLFDIIYQGSSGISLEWFLSPPESSGRDGGISSILVSTTYVLIVCIVFSLPLALACAIFLCENVRPKGPTYRFVIASLDLLSSIPSIVFGLFGFSFFVLYLGLGFSILAGGLTLGLMVLPMLTRLIQDCFENISPEIRLSAYASGLNLYAVYRNVIIPASRNNILAAVVLSICRALSETAALLYTAGYVYRMPETLLDSGRTLSVHILDLAMNVPGGNQNSYTSALTLLIFLLVINLSIFTIGKSRTQAKAIRL